jgi:hypothetical protein
VKRCAKVIASGNWHARLMSVPTDKSPPAGGHTKSGYLFISTQLKVNNHPARIIDGQAFITTFFEESAP